MTENTSVITNNHSHQRGSGELRSTIPSKVWPVVSRAASSGLMWRFHSSRPAQPTRFSTTMMMMYQLQKSLMIAFLLLRRLAVERQLCGVVVNPLATRQKHPDHHADKDNEKQHGKAGVKINQCHDLSPCPVKAQLLQVSNDSIFFTGVGPFAFHFLHLLGDVFVRVGHTENILEQAQLLLGQ